MSLTEIRQNMVDQLASQLPALKTCQPHAGRFDAAELRRVAAQAPALFLAVLQIPNLTLNGNNTRVLELSLGAFLATRDQPHYPRDTQMLDLVEQLLQLLPKAKWQDGRVRSVEPASINARNLYSGELDKSGIALWLVSWTQRAELPPP